jgi:hypothetical protein
MIEICLMVNLLDPMFRRVGKEVRSDRTEIVELSVEFCQSSQLKGWSRNRMMCRFSVEVNLGEHLHLRSKSVESM